MGDNDRPIKFMEGIRDWSALRVKGGCESRDPRGEKKVRTNLRY